MYLNLSSSPYSLNGAIQKANVNKIDIHNVYWLLGRFAKALGVWGLLGMAILLTSSIFYFVNVSASNQQLLQAQNALQIKLEQAKNDRQEIAPIKAPIQIAPAQTSAEEIAQFYKLFPAGASLPKWLRFIDATAAKQRLILNRADYKLTQSKQGQLQRYEIVLPVSGGYVQIRHFIADVLQQLPALALCDLQIKRDTAMSPTVDARLVFVLFLQGDSWLK
jgi:Tfp pilus assembly protein PilO